MVTNSYEYELNSALLTSIKFGCLWNFFLCLSVFLIADLVFAPRRNVGHSIPGFWNLGIPRTRNFFLLYLKPSIYFSIPVFSRLIIQEFSPPNRDILMTQLKNYTERLIYSTGILEDEVSQDNISIRGCSSQRFI